MEARETDDRLIPRRRIFLLNVSEECTIPQTPNRTTILNDMLKATVAALTEQTSPVGQTAHVELLIADMVPYDSLVNSTTGGNEMLLGGESFKRSSMQWEQTLQKVLCMFHNADYVSFVKRRSNALAEDASQSNFTPSNKAHRYENATGNSFHVARSVGLAAMNQYESDSDDAEYGFADEKDNTKPIDSELSDDSNEDQPIKIHNKAPAAIDGHPSGYISHSSCPPFPLMWQSAVQNVMGTMTALRALVSIDPLDAKSLPDWIALVAQTQAARLTAPANIALFPAGGRHHAKRDRADGFCIFNDIVIAVLAIQKYTAILQQKSKILVIDIDAHHGDGTEEAFAFDKTVTTMSIHGYGAGMYPGTGDAKPARATTINIPLKTGTSSDDIVKLFSQALSHILTPGESDTSAGSSSTSFSHVILVAGTDALYGDPNGGGLRLSIGGFRKMVGCVTKLSLELRIPLLILGAGGYVDTATSICWSHILADAYLGNFGDDEPFLREVPDTLEFFDSYSKHNFSML